MEGLLRDGVCLLCQREEWEDESAWKQEREQGRIRRWKREGERLKQKRNYSGQLAAENLRLLTDWIF